MTGSTYDVILHDSVGMPIDWGIAMNDAKWPDHKPKGPCPCFRCAARRAVDAWATSLRLRVWVAEGCPPDWLEKRSVRP